MKYFTAYLIILLFLTSCSSEKNKQKSDSDSVDKSAICIWDKAGIRDIPSKSGKWLASLALGEKVSLMGPVEVDSADNNREFHKVRLSDNSEGWVQSYLIVADGKLAITKKEAKIYKRADLLTGADKSFDKMDMVVIISEKGDWLEVIGVKREKSGWLKSDNITTDLVDVSFAILAGKALAIKDFKKRSETIEELLKNYDFEGSIFYYYLETKLDPFSVEKVIEVNNINQFINAISSNTKIIINAQQLNIDEADETLNANVSNEWGLHIADVSNLIITSNNENSAKLLTADTETDVISFSNCKNIYINNIIAGHSPYADGCYGGVFNFYQCSNIHINNSVLFGSGIIGLTLNGVRDFLIENSTIKECTNQIVYTEESSDLKFTTCEFINNTGYDGFGFYNSTDIVLYDCIISGNSIYYEGEENSLFFVSEGSRLEVSLCTIAGNKYDYYQTGEGVFEEYDNDLADNDFVMEQDYESGEYYDEEYYEGDGEPEDYEENY